MIDISTAPLIINFFISGKLTLCMHTYFVGVHECSGELIVILNYYNFAMHILSVPIEGLIYVTFANMPLVSQPLKVSVINHQCVIIAIMNAWCRIFSLWLFCYIRIYMSIWILLLHICCFECFFICRKINRSISE